MAWLHKFSNFQQRIYKNGRWQNKGIRNHDKTNRHWDSFGLQLIRVDRVNRLKWSEGLRGLGGPFCILAGENLPWWGFFWGPSFLEALCSKYSVVSRWQQVVVFSVVFECCMVIHKLCTDEETVSGRTWPCIIRTWTILAVWRSYETVCTLVWIVRWSCDIRVLIRDLRTVSHDSIRFIYDIDTVKLTRGVDVMCSCIYGLVRSHTVSHGLVRSLNPCQFF
jgi:hypothetical protein